MTFVSGSAEVPTFLVPIKTPLFYDPHFGPRPRTASRGGERGEAGRFFAAWEWSAAGKPGGEKEEIENTARLSGAYEFIEGFERGFKTEIGEKGVRLSGGERQKISIARAVLKDSDPIIFDEATAHLDKESEKKINVLIQERFQDKMCIIISHRIRTIPGINKIYFLEQGGIINEKMHYM